MMPATAILTVDERSDVLSQMKSNVTWPYTVAVDEARLGSLWNMDRVMRANVGAGVLILQDDLVVPPWFEAEFLKAWMPEEPMTFFVGMSEEPKWLWEKGYSYAATRNIWGQANWYPASFLKKYLFWSERAVPPLPPGSRQVKGVRNSTGDDTSVTMYLKKSGEFMLMTLPHLIDHMEVKSTMGHPSTVRGVRRVSTVFGEQYLRPWNKSKIARMSR